MSSHYGSFFKTKILGNILSEIVTYGYSLMRCFHWAVCFSSTGGRWACPTKPSIDFWFFFVSKFRICPLFTEISWKKMLGNVLSEIVTLEYSLMRCILWAVCFLWTGGRPYKTKYLFLIIEFSYLFSLATLLLFPARWQRWKFVYVLIFFHSKNSSNLKNLES